MLLFICTLCRHLLEDMPPGDIEIPREPPVVRTRDNRRRLALTPVLPLEEPHQHGKGKGRGTVEAVSEVVLMDPLQYVTYSGGLCE